MIRTSLLEDFFLIWSFPREEALRLVRCGLRPLLFEDRAWLSLAVARFRGVRLFGLPVAREALVAALLLLVEYRDSENRPRRGNFFLKTFSDHRSLGVFDRSIGFKVMERYPVPRLEEEDGGIRFELGGLFSGLLNPGLALEETKQRRMEKLFQDNHSGVLARGGQVYYTQLEKEHWKMEGLGVRLENASLMDSFSGRFEFAFNTSYGTFHWHCFRKVGPG